MSARKQSIFHLHEVKRIYGSWKNYINICLRWNKIDKIVRELKHRKNNDW